MLWYSRQVTMFKVVDLHGCFRMGQLTNFFDRFSAQAITYKGLAALKSANAFQGPAGYCRNDLVSGIKGPKSRPGRWVCTGKK